MYENETENFQATTAVSTDIIVEDLSIVQILMVEFHARSIREGHILVSIKTAASPCSLHDRFMLGNFDDTIVKVK
jgi:hypothetical protein